MRTVRNIAAVVFVTCAFTFGQAAQAEFASCGPECFLLCDHSCLSPDHHAYDCVYQHDVPIGEDWFEYCHVPGTYGPEQRPSVYEQMKHGYCYGLSPEAWFSEFYCWDSMEWNNTLYIAGSFYCSFEWPDCT